MSCDRVDVMSLCRCGMQSTAPAVNMEMTPVDEPPAVVQQRPTEPVVQQTETEIVDETKYLHIYIGSHTLISVPWIHVFYDICFFNRLSV